MNFKGRSSAALAAAFLGTGSLIAGLPAAAQEAGAGPAVQQMGAPQVLRIAKGNSVLVRHGATLERISIGDPETADAIPVSAREVVVNGKRTGTTTLLLWDQAGGRAVYNVRVVADASTLETELLALFPGEAIQARAVGNTVVLSGSTEDPRIAERAGVLAQALGEDVTVVNDIAVPAQDQVMLQVRFAEVSRNALDELGASLLTRDGNNVDVAIGPGDVAQTAQGGQGNLGIAEVFSDAVNFFLFHEPSRVAAFLSALKQKGLFKSLAEPNLLVMSGDSASFLAGGEFPFPVLQSAGAGTSNAVTIQFKEFGIRLGFAPVVTPSGSIRLRVAPEVSALDFANGLVISGFQVPALTSRKTATTVDLRDGQTFAIAGLVDNSITESVNKLPILGDIPILGGLFRSKTFRENHTELLVLVTPRLVRPVDEPPPVPTGEPETWKGKKELRESKLQQPVGWLPMGGRGPIWQ
ncbi:MAG: type II and III secretion system protein family protein [Gemmatimonadota bacterium]